VADIWAGASSWMPQETVTCVQRLRTSTEHSPTSPFHLRPTDPSQPNEETEGYDGRDNDPQNCGRGAPACHARHSRSHERYRQLAFVPSHGAWRNPPALCALQDRPILADNFNTAIVVAALGLVWSTLWKQPVADLMPFVAISLIVLDDDKRHTERGRHGVYIDWADLSKSGV